jgi:hypothetical protein
MRKTEFLHPKKYPPTAAWTLHAKQRHRRVHFAIALWLLGPTQIQSLVPQQRRCTLLFFHWYAAKRVVLVAPQVTGTRSVSLQSLHVFYMPSELTSFCFIFAPSRLVF